MKDIVVGGVAFNPVTWKGLSERAFLQKANELFVFKDRPDRRVLLRELRSQLKSLAGEALAKG